MNRYRKQYPNSTLTGAEAATRYILLKRRITNRLLFITDNMIEYLDHYDTWSWYEEIIEYRLKVFSIGFHSKRDLRWYMLWLDEFIACPPSPLP